jgi:arylsulfatase A-like enzyme
VRFIRENRAKPFFLYLAHMHVHLPLYAAARFLRASMNGPYGACVEAIDWATAVLMHEVRALGLDGNTAIIFTSDNGSRGDRGGSNSPLRGGKGSTWEGGQRVPCIVRWPGTAPAGATCREVATAMDFLPTFAGIAGACLPADRTLDGRDILPLIRGDAGARSPHDAFHYYFMHQLQAVRAGRWKLHVATDRGAVCELYDMETDPGERHNVRDEHPGVVSELQARLDACRTDLGDSLTGTPRGPKCRPVGIADDPKPLVQFDADQPYIVAMYDLPDAG